MGLKSCPRADLWHMVVLCFADNTTVAFKKVRAIQSSTFRKWFASLAVDNDFSTVACTHHISSNEPWWAVDLNTPMDVARVTVTNDNHTKYG